MTSPFGDRAYRFALPDAAPRRALLERLKRLAGVEDVVIAEDVGCVTFAVADEAARARLEAALAEPFGPQSADGLISHVVPVIYDGEDLWFVAQAIDRTIADVIALHSEAEHRVAMLGFLPGFAYLRGAPALLDLPRRSPRPRVPPGSVGIAAGYTGIYPLASPGGWNLIGHTTLAMFDPMVGATFGIGDRVRFTPVTELPHVPAVTRAPPPSLSAAYLEVTRTVGFAVIVDGGRRGRMHEGIPPGGPLVRSLFEAANALAENPPGTAAVELTGTFEVVARGGKVVVADSERRVELEDGERYVVSTTGSALRAGYLAIAGGVQAPVILGGRGALLSAGIGELLKKGSVLGAGAEPRRPAAVPDVELDGPIEVIPGPDSVPGIALDELLGKELRVAPASDRTGTRLDGAPPLPRGYPSRPSVPMVRGAIELTPSGLVVLGPDHPTTGGYPVVGVVRDRSQDAFFARPLGAAVRFTLV